MDSLSLFRRVYYSYLSRAYSLMYWLAHRSILGFRLVHFVRWLPILILLYGRLKGWPAGILLVLLALIIWANFSLWRAKRDNYNRFVADNDFLAGEINRSKILSPNEKIAVRATGLFSVSGRESNLLLRPAEYWRVPLGEHVVMAEEKPGKYLYQFFSAQTLQRIQRGWLLFGPEPVETLAISFLARWGPDFTRFGQVLEDGSDAGQPSPKRITIYLSPVDATILEAIWHTVIADAQQARLEKG